MKQIFGSRGKIHLEIFFRGLWSSRISLLVCDCSRNLNEASRLYLEVNNYSFYLFCELLIMVADPNLNREPSWIRFWTEIYNTKKCMSDIKLLFYSIFTIINVNEFNRVVKLLTTVNNFIFSQLFRPRDSNVKSR